MATNETLLHIRDSYYFEVPKWMWPHNHETLQDFPDVWVSLDPEFQAWQAEQVYHELDEANVKGIPGEHDFLHSYEHWTHLEGNHGKPVKRYLEELKTPVAEGGKGQEWAETAHEIALGITVDQYKALEEVKWAPSKIKAYNEALSGRVLIPQPPGVQLRNLYEKESGFAISKFMVIELLVAVVISVLFVTYAKKIASGKLAKGPFWNLIDVFITFIRDGVVKGNIQHGAEKFVPILWTLFFFVLGCNLFGMIPFMGSPTGAFSVGITLAVAIFAMGVGAGIKELGAVGFWTNFIPGIDLPWYMAMPIKALMFVIEVGGLFIKHGVLGVRILANMVAGHAVLVSVMSLGVMAIRKLPLEQSIPIAIIVFVSCILLSCLELFVAFLQAYVFSLLSALFIDSETHSH